MKSFRKENLPLLIFTPGETVGDYFFFLAAGFFLVALLTLAFFAITLIFYYGLTYLRHGSFSEGEGIMLAGAMIVNDRSRIHRTAKPAFPSKDSRR